MNNADYFVLRNQLGILLQYHERRVAKMQTVILSNVTNTELEHLCIQIMHFAKQPETAIIG